MWEIANIGMKSNPYTVAKVEKTYGGIHYCTLDRSGSTALMRKIIVEVLYPPNNVDIAPSSSIQDDTTLNLTCSTDSSPTASFTWRYDPSYYAPVISEGPVLTIDQLNGKRTVYCTATNIMIPTNGIPVEKMATAEFITTDDGNTFHSEQRSTGEGGFENNGNDDLGLVTVTILGWVIAAVAVVVAIFLYMHIRVISKRDTGTIETRSPLFRSGPANNTSRVFASNSQNTSERMKMSRSKSSIDCSNDEKPKVPDRPPQTLSLDKVPLHSYIELQNPDDSTQHGCARPDSEDIYEHIEDGMPDPRKRYEDLNQSEMDVKVEEKKNEGYLMPVQQDGDVAFAE